MLTNSILERRLLYVKAGYEPLPCIGKRPAPASWPTIPIDLDTPATWSAAYPNATNTGIRTRRAPAVDIDIYDAAMAERIEDVLRATVSQPSLLRRIGKPPKRLIPFRCDVPFAKIIAKFKAPDDDKTIHTIEVLADGQQYIAEGDHPDTGQPYRWEGGDLLSVPREQLSLLNEATARHFIDKAAAIMTAAGWIETGKTNGKTSTPLLQFEMNAANPYYHFALKDECKALAAMSKDSGRNNALNRAAFNLFQLVAAGGLDANVVRERLFAAAETCGLVADDGEKAVRDTIESGARAGRTQPRQAPDPGSTASAHDDDGDELRIIWASDLEMCGITWLWPGRFALGKIGLIAGLPDYGKGQIAAFLAAAATADIALPCDEGNAPQGSVIWFNAEDDNRDTIIPRLTAAGANLKRIAFVNGARIDGKDKSFSIVTDLLLLRKAVQQIGNVVLVIIDPISAYLGVGKVDSRSATDVRGVLTPLKEMVEELHVAIIGIAHFNKKDDIKSALLRVSDSIAYVAAARHVYAVLDDPEDKNSKLFVKAKNNLAPDKKALRYGFGVKTVGHDPKLNVDIDAPYIVWHPQHVELTANEAMQAATGQSGYAGREARDFLLDRLEGGRQVKADDLFEEAEQNGISKVTLRRAKKKLGIKSRKTPGKFDGEWTWELPPEQAHPTPQGER
jgi:putative DNA primase/helicase